jgi:hypothetical protein
MTQIDLEELIDAKKRKTNMTTTPKKRAFRVGKLKTVQDVVAETAKLYRRTVHGHVDSNDAARQSGILANIRQGMEQSLIELRLSNIEDTILRLAANKSAPMLLESRDREREPKKT